MFDLWCVMSDLWWVIYDGWCVIYGMWCVMGDFWYNRGAIGMPVAMYMVINKLPAKGTGEGFVFDTILFAIDTGKMMEEAVILFNKRTAAVSQLAIFCWLPIGTFFTRMKENFTNTNHSLGVWINGHMAEFYLPVEVQDCKKTESSFQLKNQVYYSRCKRQHNHPKLKVSDSYGTTLLLTFAPTKQP